MKKGFFFLLFFLFATSFAQEAPNAPKPTQNAANQTQKAPNQSQFEIPNPGASYPNIAQQGIVLIFLALLPFLVMLLTSFMKIVITLSLLRSALGVQQIPPNQVINGIALILTIYVMFPTGMAMFEKAKPILQEGPQPTELISAASASKLLEVIDVSKEPLRDFLIRNTTKKHMDDFYKLAQKTFPKEVSAQMTNRDFIIVIPSFITTQVKNSFEIGVLIYLPFFVVDLVVSNILLAMQMMMLSPLSIALPLKLLLLVMIDGWTILVQGLVLSFN